MIFSKKLFRFYFLRICELVYKGVLIFGLAAKRFAGGLENLLIHNTRGGRAVPRCRITLCVHR